VIVVVLDILVNLYVIKNIKICTFILLIYRAVQEDMVTMVYQEIKVCLRTNSFLLYE
jgi:hypothetical protein